MVDTLIKNFTQISKTDTEIAGGKGASLGEMTQAGIPVPEGFVILSNAFERFIEETDLNVEISAILDTVDIKAVHTVENASENIQAMILSKEMPDDIKTDILKFYENLDCKFVAVRSSATSEDSASAAWAGQLESYLNTTKETLLENVKKCWASLFTPRAIFYRFEKKLNKDKISVAVVVQKMVDSEESGIAFSVHPVTQDENQIIIEAGFGLGEAIVSGSITPDSYVVDKQGFDILDINVNEQTKALYKKAKGGNEWKELGDRGKKQVLTVKEIYELSKLIVKIENHYGFPCDIEWAKSRGEYYITQSRPITTLVDAGKNKKTKWKFIVDRPLSVLAIAMLSTCYSSSYIKRYLDIDGLLDGNLFIPNRTFAPDGIIKQIKEYQVKKHKEEGNKYLWKMAELCESKGEALIAESQKLFSLNIGDLPNKNLAEELMGIVEQSRDYSPFIITIWFLESYLEEIVKSLKKKIPKDFHEYLEMPEKYNETQKEARAILELAVSDKATLKQKIRNYIDDYGWMQIKYFIVSFGG